MFSSPFKKYSKKLRELYEELDSLADDDCQIAPGSEADELSKIIDSYIEEDYAKAVFDYYSKREPKLIRIHTGEEITWSDAFGGSFEGVSKSLRHSLVGLVEGEGRYKIK